MRLNTLAPVYVSPQSIAAVNERSAAVLMEWSRKRAHMGGCYRAVFTKGLQAPGVTTTPLLTNAAGSANREHAAIPPNTHPAIPNRLFGGEAQQAEG
jgi:hypothetical protein